MFLYGWLFVALIVLTIYTVTTSDFGKDDLKNKAEASRKTSSPDGYITTASETQQPKKVTMITTKRSKEATKRSKKPKYSHIKGFEEDGYQEGVKPPGFQDFMDRNLKKIIIGVIAVISVCIVTVVCCCVCCAATVCNPTRKQRNTAATEARQEQAEIQDYLQYYTGTYNPTSPRHKTADRDEVPLHYSKPLTATEI